MRLDPVSALVYQSSDQEISVSLPWHLSHRSYWSWEACEPDSEGYFPLCFVLNIRYLMSNICRKPVRIWKNYYQSLFSVSEKWFWACVKTGLGSWWQMGTSSSCSCLSRGCKACAGSAASCLLLCTLLQVLWPSPRACVTPDLISPQLWAAVVVMVLVKYHLVFWPVASWLWLTCTVVCDAQCQVIK